MPSAFHFEAPNGGSSLTGVHPGMFRPPISPSASSSGYLGRSIDSSNAYADPSAPGPTAKRKRPPAHNWTGFGIGASAQDHQRSDFSGDGQMGGIGGGAEHRYVLAGHIETLNGFAPTDPKDAMDDSFYSDVDYRKALGSKRPHHETESIRLNADGADPTLPASQTNNNNSGWGSFALSTLGGVVGKVWEFCKTGAFRGFYAGGGKGFDIANGAATGATPSQLPAGQVWYNEHDVPTLPPLESGATTTSTGFPQSDLYYHDTDSAPATSSFGYQQRTAMEEEGSTTPPPAAKRRQISREWNTGTTTPGDELNRNWVVVEEPAPAAPAARRRRQGSGASRATMASPDVSVLRRRIVGRPAFPRYHASSSSSSSLGRGASSISHAGAAGLSTREPASFASPRPQSPSVGAPHYGQYGAGAASPASVSTPASRIPVPSGRPQTPAAFSPRLSIGGGSHSHHKASQLQPSLIPSPSAGGPHYSSPFGSPASKPGFGPGHRRNHSGASAASGRLLPRPRDAEPASGSPFEHTGAGIAAANNTTASNTNSPRLDAEARTLAARRARAEMEADIRMNDFNARIRDMIRQGREALGTTVEVELDMEDVDADEGGVGAAGGSRRGRGGVDIWEDE
ncbi:hypothetical protein GGS23DRAFT_598010 [Durotheca rogersii]|uniref:uncharacterized protein n=1 Tax=Durotheca rogersii TaxID=419775 RepID=UPI00221FED79|nr:uncharacterized protein GGS23DRAFT_598010 [Durotheca rogersii]KAI5861994.1 hypothetical protein GGS23DRAFT_598010 [Durotheca rogersii]